MTEWLVGQSGGHRPLDTEPPAPTFPPWPRAGAGRPPGRGPAGPGAEAAWPRRGRPRRRRGNGSTGPNAEFAEYRTTLQQLLADREVKLAEARADAEAERGDRRVGGRANSTVRVLSSTSWKVTGPLRSVLARLGR